MNAFTTREKTTTTTSRCWINTFPRHSTFWRIYFSSGPDSEKKEIEKEKQVILEEIRMVQDDPEDLVQELHAKLVMGRHPLVVLFLGGNRRSFGSAEQRSSSNHYALSSRRDRARRCREFQSTAA